MAGNPCLARVFSHYRGAFETRHGILTWIKTATGNISDIPFTDG
jgi:hypothetical protein